MPWFLHRPPAARTLAGSLATLTAAGVLGVTPTAPAEASSAWPGHPDRSLVRHVVARGDTATGLATRYHAWTAELLSLNHLDGRGSLRLGQTVVIPVVVSRARAAGRHVGRRHLRKPPVLRPTTPPKGWHGTDLSRSEVRVLVTRAARHYGVPPRLALAVAWQESGWQQRRVSATGAIGVMQVMPDTGRWMRWYAGRPLRLRDARDNIVAGVLTLRTLRGRTRRDVTAIAAYYQGLRSVRHVGWFDDTTAYVRAVLAHERRLAHGLSPR